MRLRLTTAIALSLVLGVQPCASVAATPWAHEICGKCHLRGNDVPNATDDGGATVACTSCHEGKQPAAATAHGCLACHAHHPNELPAQLRNLPPREGAPLHDRTTRICLSCHEKAGPTDSPHGKSISHPVGVAVARPEDDAGLPLFQVEGADADVDVVGCLTCHVPHPTDHPKLLRWSAGNEPAACTSCHNMEGTLGALPVR